MYLDSTKFRELASAIQSIILAAAIIIGGGWTLYNFIQLDEIGKREAELENLQRSLYERAKLDIRLASKALVKTEQGHRYLSITIEIENKGNLREVFLWRDSGLKAARVSISDTGNRISSKVKNIPFSRLDVPAISEAILPGHSRRFPFLIRFDEAGIYHIEFFATVSPEEEQKSLEDHKTAGSEAVKYQWTESTYVYIK